MLIESKKKIIIVASAVLIIGMYTYNKVLWAIWRIVEMIIK